LNSRSHLEPYNPDYSISSDVTKPTGRVNPFSTGDDSSFMSANEYDRENPFNPRREL
jgi:hypothetical protein